MSRLKRKKKVACSGAGSYFFFLPSSVNGIGKGRVAGTVRRRLFDMDRPVSICFFAKTERAQVVWAVPEWSLKGAEALQHSRRNALSLIWGR